MPRTIDVNRIYTNEELDAMLNIVNEENTSKDNGIVLKQSIDTGTTVDEGTTVTITVNKLEETKSATVTINVKSITGGYKETSSSEKEENSTKRLRSVLESLQMQEPLPESHVRLANVHP